jgi:DNA-binding transcriptional MerR regulator
VREFFSIGDVCTLTGLKPHVLRYWETQFRFLSPTKNRSGNRVYQRREVELILLVKHLLYSEKYTIEGARRKVDEHRKTGGVRTMSRVALERETLEAIERELAGLVGDLSLAADRPLASRTVALASDWNEGSAAESG